MSLLHAFGMLFGRICLSILFIHAGIGKFLNYDSTAQFMASKGFTFVPFFLISAALVEIIGGLSVLLGLKTRWGATLLILFLIPTTVIFHAFWNQPDQMNKFLANLAIFGGLFYVLVNGAGRFSIDALLSPKNR